MCIRDSPHTSRTGMNRGCGAAPTPSFLCFQKNGPTDRAKDTEHRRFRPRPQRHAGTPTALWAATLPHEAAKVAASTGKKRLSMRREATPNPTLSASVFACVCFYVRMFLCVCVCSRTWVRVCERACVSVRVWVRADVCVWACACVGDYA